MTGSSCLRRRMPAATLPCTSRNHSRIHGRIASLNRKVCGLFVLTRTTCAMACEKYLPQGFLLTLEVWSLA